MTRREREERREKRERREREEKEEKKMGKGRREAQGDKRRPPKKGGKKGAAQSTPLDEARRLQKKGERETGRGNFSENALRLYQSAIEMYRSVSQDVNESEDALVGLAECYHYSAEIMAGQVVYLKNLGEEQVIKQKVIFLSQQSAEAYKVLKERGVEPKEEICVNLGTTLATWAENLEYPACLGVYQQALAEYNSGLQIGGANSDTMLNKGDLLQSLAEVFNEAGDMEKARAAFIEANKTYDAACAVTDSTMGDDFVGLLEHWGASLLSFAGILEGEQQDQAIQQSLNKLSLAVQLDRSSTKGMNAIGDVHVLLSERNSTCQAMERINFLEEALKIGYCAALTVDRNNLDAQVGYAETYMEMGKLYRGIGDQAKMGECFVTSARKYIAIVSDQNVGVHVV